ncbi:MFS general substrate transporter [Penicillium argentinense]|uniref:MFS general substrate transporter n=1 Tax=Penicillium argentinense TaxID=1131581 RepID=A0A9W9F794_9EURO|nr:MFS general substrate transporter [Penicillium argentinense]KAJ5094899.1 MFS general substrate transporter [Penicillium argentinense]
MASYLASRFPTILPSFDPVPNPFKLVALVNRRQWMFFSVKSLYFSYPIGFVAWTWDAFDFFTVAMTVTDLSETFGKTREEITWGITITLMFRSVGSIIFGILSDRYGRKWPFIANNMLFIVFELATGFCQTFTQFLVTRAFYGIAMGGIYGNAAATALEDAPEAARGLLSGMMQQGWSFGFLFATIFARALVNTTSYGWRPLFWFGACPPVLFIIARLLMPETNVYQQRAAVRAEMDSPGKVFFKEGKVALKKHWMLLIYMTMLMAGFNFMSHGSQDLYPTLLKSQFDLSANQVTVTQVVANLGAILGGLVAGYTSQIFGRRFSILWTCVIGGTLLYPYTFVSNERVMVAAFFEQFCVQGAWGVIPIHLMELAPPSLRTFVVGTAYQLGNLVSSASATIEATIGQRFPLPSKVVNGKIVTHFNYGLVMCIFMACVYVYVIFLTFLGPEKRSRPMDIQEDDEILPTKEAELNNTNSGQPTKTEHV